MDHLNLWAMSKTPGMGQLTTPQLVEMFYRIYNPITAHNEKIEDMSKVDIEDI